MSNFSTTFDQLLQTLITTLKHQFPIIRALPVTNQYFKDILQLLKQNDLLPERPLKRLSVVQGFIVAPDQIDHQSIQYMHELLDYYHGTSTAKEAQSSNESRLAKLFAQLDISSALSVVDGYTDLTDLQNYLNIQLPTQDILRQILGGLEGTNRSLTLICGASGTGKSQLLANLRTKKSRIFELPNLNVKDDAGLGNDSEVSMNERLLLDFHSFNDHELTSKTTYHQITTIHTELLKRFYHLAKKLGTYTELTELIAATNLFEGQPENVLTKNIQIIFVDQQPACPITTTSDHDTLFDQLTNKIFAANPYKNPFYRAYQSDLNQNIHSSLHTNYYILTHPEVLTSIKHLLIKAQITHDSIFSIREILTFLHDITVPSIGQRPLYNTIFFLMFPKEPQTRVLEHLATCDPATARSPELSILLGRFYKMPNKEAYMIAALKHQELPSNWLSEFFNYYVDKPTSEVLQARLFLRILFLFDHEMPLFEDKIYASYFHSFLEIRQGYFNNELANCCYAGLKSWYNLPNIQTTPLNLKIYYMDTGQTNITIHLAALNRVGEQHYHFQLTLPLFELFYKISKSYVLRPQDRHEVQDFDDFIQDLVTSLKQSNDISDLKSS